MNHVKYTKSHTVYNFKLRQLVMCEEGWVLPGMYITQDHELAKRVDDWMHKQLEEYKTSTIASWHKRIKDEDKS